MLFSRKGVYASLNQEIKAYIELPFSSFTLQCHNYIKEEPKNNRKNLHSTGRTELGQIIEILYSRKKTRRIKPTMFKYFPPLW